MGDLVFISDGKPVTDSLTVSDVFNKRHSDVYETSKHKSKN